MKNWWGGLRCYIEGFKSYKTLVVVIFLFWVKAGLVFGGVGIVMGWAEFRVVHCENPRLNYFLPKLLKQD
jgi:hypothetical protein